jgi:hypothetical protein
MPISKSQASAHVVRVLLFMMWIALHGTEMVSTHHLGAIARECGMFFVAFNLLGRWQECSVHENVG